MQEASVNLLNNQMVSSLSFSLNKQAHKHIPCGNVANSITSKLLPVHFLQKDTYFICCVICEKKSESVVQDNPKLALAIGSGLEESRLSQVND